MGNTASAFGFYDTDSESTQPGNILRSVTGAYTAAVFVIVPIDNIMAAIFDAPVSAVDGKHVFRVGLVRRSTCNAICDFTGILTTSFLGSLPLDEKGLSDMREVEVIVEFGCGPYFADFNPTVIRGIELDEIRIFPVFKVQCDVLKKCGLVVFDSEVVMSVTFSNQIVGDVSLGQEGICGNFFTLNIDGIK